MDQTNAHDSIRLYEEKFANAKFEANNIKNLKNLLAEYKDTFRQLNYEDRKLHRDILKLNIQKLSNLEQSEDEKVIEIERNDLIKHGNKLLNLSDDRLKNILKTVDETKQIGIDIAGNLQNQNEQLKNLDTDLYNIEDELTRAKKILVRMIRRSTNKYCVTMAMIIFLSIVFIIIWENR